MRSNRTCDVFSLHITINSNLSHAGENLQLIGVGEEKSGGVAVWRELNQRSFDHFLFSTALSD